MAPSTPFAPLTTSFPTTDPVFVQVYENLRSSALLRLPAAMSAAAKMQLVDDTLSMLHMHHVRHSLVGSVEKRGISGGQRKRVNIGMEVVAKPSLLFLDGGTGVCSSFGELDFRC